MLSSSVVSASTYARASQCAQGLHFSAFHYAQETCFFQATANSSLHVQQVPLCLAKQCCQFSLLNEWPLSANNGLGHYTLFIDKPGLQDNETMPVWEQ